jgi:hypothetical protein
MRHIVTGLLSLILLAGACLAEDAAPAKYYKLEFVVKEVDAGKVLNSRTYFVMGSTSREHDFIRTGSRVPYSEGEKTSYLDVGVNIDVRSLQEASGQLTLRVDADISSVASESTPNHYLPVVRQNRWSSDVTVPLRKPAMIFSSDDLTTKHQMQLELTATPIT